MITEKSVRLKKNLILLCGILLSFFTSMSKILIPGTIMNQLQMDLAMTAAQAALIGTVFMYSYAFSQFLMGIFSDRYGGVRLLLIGGCFFSVGMMAVPFLSSVWSLCLFRGITALGAGTVFLGVAKLVNDLYPKQFTLVLGIALLCGYLGPATGVYPVSWMARSVSWRFALLVPAVISALLVCGIVFLSPGTIRRTLPGNMFRSLGKICMRRDNWLLFFSTALFFGMYYSLLLFVGQKALEDFGGLGTSAAALWMTFFCLVVAGGNIAANWILKLLHGHGRNFLLCCGAFALTGALLGFCSFFFNFPAAFVIAAFFLITVPAGMFSGYSDIAVRQNPDLVGLAVSMLNFWAFIGIAAVNHISGLIMNTFQSQAVRTEHALVYPAEAYRAIFLFYTILACCSLVMIAFLRRDPKK